MAERAEGTHLQLCRPRGGWPNTCKPELRPGRKITKARQRLSARITNFESSLSKGKGASGYRRPGSLKCK